MLKYKVLKGKNMKIVNVIAMMDVRYEQQTLSTSPCTEGFHFLVFQFFYVLGKVGPLKVLKSLS